MLKSFFKKVILTSALIFFLVLGSTSFIIEKVSAATISKEKPSRKTSTRKIERKPKKILKTRRKRLARGKHRQASSKRLRKQRPLRQKRRNSLMLKTVARRNFRSSKRGNARREEAQRAGQEASKAQAEAEAERLAREAVAREEERVRLEEAERVRREDEERLAREAVAREEERVRLEEAARVRREDEERLAREAIAREEERVRLEEAARVRREAEARRLADEEAERARREAAAAEERLARKATAGTISTSKRVSATIPSTATMTTTTTTTTATTRTLKATLVTPERSRILESLKGRLLPTPPVAKVLSAPPPPSALEAAKDEEAHLKAEVEARVEKEKLELAKLAESLEEAGIGKTITNGSKVEKGSDSDSLPPSDDPSSDSIGGDFSPDLDSADDSRPASPRSEPSGMSLPDDLLLTTLPVDAGIYLGSVDFDSSKDILKKLFGGMRKKTADDDLADRTLPTSPGGSIPTPPPVPLIVVDSGMPPPPPLAPLFAAPPPPPVQGVDQGSIEKGVKKWNVVVVPELEENVTKITRQAPTGAEDSILTAMADGAKAQRLASGMDDPDELLSVDELLSQNGPLSDSWTPEMFKELISLPTAESEEETKEEIKEDITNMTASMAIPDSRDDLRAYRSHGSNVQKRLAELLDRAHDMNDEVNLIYLTKLKNEFDTERRDPSRSEKKKGLLRGMIGTVTERIRACNTRLENKAEKERRRQKGVTDGESVDVEKIFTGSNKATTMLEKMKEENIDPKKSLSSSGSSSDDDADWGD